VADQRRNTARQWLIGSGRAPRSYIASQGTALGRAGRVYVDQIGDGIWIGGATTLAFEIEAPLGVGLLSIVLKSSVSGTTTLGYYSTADLKFGCTSR